MEQDRKFRYKPMPIIYDKGEKTGSSISGAWKTGQLHVKKLKLEHSLTPYTKISSKLIKHLNVR